MVSRPGESFLNMMSTIQKMLKTATKKDGWSNKTKEDEKVMKKMSASVLSN
jgi:hypothetical protein